MDNFKIFDILSQRDAIREYLNNKSREEKVEWLSERGSINLQSISGIDHYLFESETGLKAVFFFDANNEIVFIGEHTTFT